jgi:hypothetical protein
MKRREQLTVWYCEFCTAQFATFNEILPYCTNCGNDEDVTVIDNERVFVYNDCINYVGVIRNDTR